MALLDRFRREPERQSVGLTELMERYDLHEVNPAGWIVVSEKAGQQFASPVSDVSKTELGYASASMYSRMGSDEYNPELRGWLGLNKWNEMRRSDGSVRGVLRLVKTPVLAARWFLEPASTSAQDKKVAKFVQDCLTKKMSVSWPQLLTEICSHLDFGYYSFEKVFTFQDGKVVWQKWAPRHPMSVYEWVYDSHGGPNGMWAYSETAQDGRIFIPIRRLLVFTNEKEAGNMEGVSILRGAYKHWYFADNLYKIDAIQKERHGIGVPVIKLPPGFTEDDKEAANALGANLRTNEKAHIVLPPMWDILMLKMEGQPVDALESANFHSQKVYDSVLANFMYSDKPDPDKVQLFNKATRFVADQICDVINKWAIPELVNFNWKTVDDYPQLRVRRIGETVDWQKISMALRNLTGAAILKPDDALEAWIRDEMDLPMADPETSREIATPQLPKPPTQPKVGQPRQSTTQNSTQGSTPGNTGRTTGPGGSGRTA